MNKPLIFISNDDGVNAPGLQALIEMVRPLGELFVMAPMEPQSGMSHAITVKTPLRVHKIREEKGLTIYSCNGTPADCVKLALCRFVSRTPDLLVSGVNHGSNSSVSVVYSGTMAAAAEGALYHIPALGFSLCDYSREANFSAVVSIGKPIVEMALEKGLPEGIALNINFPALSLEEIKGVKVCRQNKGTWNEEFDQRTDPNGFDYYWLSGYYVNEEPEANDTDEAALDEGYVSIVPVHFDLTAYHFMQEIKKFEEINKKFARKT
ncbi:MAG: 5'/3'-nucleotidase SurE [Prevotellaceae bacterium]|jgi:5'-nucleotidase|nr:5'/3'-nucleotidase SurE [Prevotellaceae bacterium]